LHARFEDVASMGASRQQSDDECANECNAGHLSCKSCRQRPLGSFSSHFGS
jgi:hypothetical protein